MPLRPMTEQEKLDTEIGKMLRTKVVNNPQVRRDLYRTLKKVDPNVHWPDQAMQDLRDELRREREQEKIKAETERLNAEAQNSRARILDRFGEEDTKKIEALMVKHSIHDYDVAAKLYAAEAPPPSQSSDYSSRNRWTMPSDKELIDNPAKWANEMAHKTIAEFRAKSGLPIR